MEMNYYCPNCDLPRGNWIFNKECNFYTCNKCNYKFKILNNNKCSINSKLIKI